jgi:hypothetical protein
METNLIGTIVNQSVTATTTTIYATFRDSKTGLARTPISTTNCFVLDKDTENFEIILVDSHVTASGVTTLTVNASGRSINLSGDFQGFATGKTHSLNAEIGCVEIHTSSKGLEQIMKGINNTTANNFRIGADTDNNITIYAMNGDANPPYLRYVAATDAWVYAPDGVTENPMGGAGALVAGDGIDITGGVIKVDLVADYGIHAVGGNLSLELKADSGLTADVNGLQVQLAANSGLQFNTGLEAKLKTGGGILKDASGLYAQVPSLETVAYTYGESIAINDLLYLKASDNRVWKVTSSAETWKTIVGVAMEAGDAAATGKRILLRGLVDTAFSAIQPTFASSGGAVGTQFGDAVNTRAKAWRLNNTAGPECVVNGVGTIRIKKTGTPTGAFYIGLCLGSATVPYVGWYTAQVRPYGMILAEDSIAQLDIGNVYDDEEFTFTNVVIPANTYVWVVCWTQAAADAANYYWIENTATAGGATLVTAAAACQWVAANFLPNYSLTMSSVNPWEKHYAVRAYNGTNGGYGIGDNAATLPWNRVIGHVVSATQWYLNPLNNNIDSGTFIDSQDDTVPSWLDTSITDLGFRPSWIDFSITSHEAVVGTRACEGYSNYIANAALANSVQGYALGIDLLGVPLAAPYTGTMYSSTSTAWAYYAIPFENGFYFSDTPRVAGGAGTDPWPSANLLSIGVKYVASQK